jgi:hypothetical protein
MVSLQAAGLKAGVAKRPWASDAATARLIGIAYGMNRPPTVAHDRGLAPKRAASR